MATTKTVHASKKELVAEQTQHIINKLQVRTNLMVEALPAEVKDERDPWFAKYEAEHFDNPKSAAYQNRQVALTAAIAAGISTENFELRTTVAQSLEARRGTVVVLIDTKLYTWENSYGDFKAGDVLVCSGENAGLFQRAGDTKGTKLALTNQNARYADDGEIEAFVKAAIKARPMHFIKQLGDASELEALS